MLKKKKKKRFRWLHVETSFRNQEEHYKQCICFTSIRSYITEVSISTSNRTLPVITWYAIFTIRPKCQHRTAIYVECEVVYPDFFWCIDCIVGQMSLLCAEAWLNLTERNVYSLRTFIFINTSMLVRKTWDALHIKNIFATFTLLANADKIQKYKIEWSSETKKLLLLTLWQRPQEHFNRHPHLWHPYALIFDVIPYTLNTNMINKH